MDGNPTPGAAPPPAGRAPDLNPQQAAYVDQVRGALAGLATPEARPGDIRAALAAVEHHAAIDPDPPTVSRRFSARLARHAFRRLTGWDPRYLGAQVTVLGQSIVRWGATIGATTERLDAESARLAHDLASVTARLERLESEAAGR
jgi:hypothetical protein